MSEKALPIGYNLEEHSKPSRKPFFSCLGCFLAGSALSLLGVLVPGFLKPEGHGQLTACKSNLKNIATAVELYASDNQGQYPHKLNDLLAKSYFQGIPICPACGKDSYSASYRAQGSQFTVFCSGDNHARALPGSTSRNLPAYSGGLGSQP